MSELLTVEKQTAKKTSLLTFEIERETKQGIYLYSFNRNRLMIISLRLQLTTAN